MNYISHLIGHEGPGSLFCELKERNWCEELGAGYRDIPGFSFFFVEINLTEEALNHIDEIVKLLFQVVYYPARIVIQYVVAPYFFEFLVLS